MHAEIIDAKSGIENRNNLTFVKKEISLIWSNQTINQ
jgi:hypothetical protein